MSLLPGELKVILGLQMPAVCQAELRELIDPHLLTNCQHDPGAYGCLALPFSRHYLCHTHQPYLVSENQDAAGSQVRQCRAALCQIRVVWGWGWAGLCDLEHRSSRHAGEDSYSCVHNSIFGQRSSLLSNPSSSLQGEGGGSQQCSAVCRACVPH